MKKGKKTLLLLLACTTVAVGSVALAACTDPLPPPAHTTHNLTKTDEVPSTCETAGTQAYWSCNGCDKLFSDAEGENEITAPAPLPLAAHSGTKTDKVDADCEKTGTEEYWTCDDCGTKFSDEACTQEIDAPATLRKHPNATKTDEVPSTCETQGTAAYWTCDDCEKKFSDEDCTNEITTPATLPLAQHNVTKTDEVPSTCETQGTAEYWTCDDCEKKFADEDCTDEITAPATLPLAQHNGTKTDEVPSTCETQGTAEYWTCGVCDKKFSDADCTDEITAPATLPLAQHNGTKTDEVPATCETEGAEAYWTCGVCDKKFSDADCTDEISEPATIKKHPRLASVAALSTDKKVVNTGNSHDNYASMTYARMKHYKCPDCNTLFSDENAKLQLASCYRHTRMGLLVEDEVATSSISSYGKMLAYQANVDGLFKFELEGATVMTIIYIDNESYGNAFANGSWNKSASFYSKFENTDGIPTTEATVQMNRNDLIVITVTGTANATFTLTRSVSSVNYVRYGANEVEVTVENSAFEIDAYFFKPTETKTYSITVPAGVSVSKDGESFIVASDNEITLNFAATAGKPIKFCFRSNVIDSYPVTIGDGVMGTLVDGENDVKITVPSSMSDVDVYVFTPGETKTYSLSVPEGMEVLMDGANFISGNMEYKNFDGVEGTPITFCFINSTVGTYKVTVGDAIYPKIEVDVSTTVIAPSNGGGSINAGTLEVAEGVEEGTYSFVLSGAGIRGVSGGCFYVYVNGNPTRLELAGTEATNSWNKGTVGIVFMGMNGYVVDETADADKYVEASVQGFTFKMTLKLKAGDRISFVQSGMTDASITVVMTKVVAEQA